jgi:tripartite-type tricarboxylate transporter receptor subunit TctC
MGGQNVTRLFPIAAVAMTLGSVLSAQAQVYPSHPITMMVPFAAGGPTDVIARVLAEGMRGSLGQPVIVENVTGAGGNIGVGRVARATPDGYTVVVGHWSTHVVNGAIYTLPYDVVSDFAPIAPISTNPQVMVSKNAVPAKDLRELIAWLKSSPGKATLATVGAGSQPHVAGVLFQKLTGTTFQFVPYRGAAPAMQDLLGGQIDLMIPQAIIAIPQVQSGKIRAYAVTAKTRLQYASDIPTVDEAGAPGLYVSSWHGLWAPKGTPKDVAAKLNSAVKDALADPIVRQKLVKLGQELWPREQQTPETLAVYQKAEIEKWWPIIKAAGIKAE